jgi:CRP/FNR family transcriptional regulator, anaerobic regulatory protein
MFTNNKFKELFQDLFVDQESLLNELSDIAIKRKVKKGAFLFKEGESVTSVYMVYKGALKLYYLNADFKELILSFGFENSIIRDYLSALGHSNQYLNLQAFENSIVFEFPVDKFIKICNTYPNNDILNRYILTEIVNSQKRILLNIGGSAEDRYDDFIKHFKNFTNRIPDRYIASYIGVTPEFFSKLKKKKIREYLEFKVVESYVNKFNDRNDY